MNLSDMTPEQRQEIERQLKELQEQESQAAQQKRDEYESLREQTVTDIYNRAMAINAQMVVFKDWSFGELKALDEMLSEYSGRRGKGKGNLTVKNDADTVKITFKHQELGDFDERSKEAEAHIQEFVADEFKDENTRELITKLLERKKGSLDIKLVQKLYSMEDRFTDERWRKGIKLLKESWRIKDTRTYINIYHREQGGQWQAVSLNLSAIA